MKRFLTIAGFLCCLTLGAIAQEKITSENFDASKVERIDFQFKYPELVKINTWDKKEVKIEANVYINDGENNDDFKLKSKIRNGALVIESEIENLSSYRNYTMNRDKDRGRGGVTISKNGSTISRNGRWGRNSVTVSVILTVTVPAGMEVDMIAQYGMVEVLSNASPLKIDAKYGGVDVVVDETSNLEISASTQWGQIYHNLDAKLRAKGDGFPGKWMRTEASLNRGTRKLQVESQYGNVYLRKNN